MNKLFTSGAAAALGALLLGPVYAQDTSSAPTPGQQAAPAYQPQAQQQDLTGQVIYNAKGRKIGTVSAMSTNAQGEQVAVVGIEKFLGMGGKNVEMPVSTLSPKDGGGYTTSLTSADIKKLPVAAGSKN